MRRARNRTRSRVASSPQCRSSTTSARGRDRSASSTAAKISCWAAPPGGGRHVGPSSRATSRSGPSGRGVLRESHIPHSTGTGACAANSRRRTVFRSRPPRRRARPNPDPRPRGGRGRRAPQRMVALQQAHVPSLENQRSRRTDRSRESGSVPDTEPRRGWQGGHRPDPGST